VSLPKTPDDGSVPYFAVELVRALSLIVLGLVIAFTPGHSALFGIFALGIFLVINAITLGAVVWGVRQPAQARGLHLWQALVSLVVGLMALALNQAGIALLLWAVVLWGLLTGVAEIFAGWRMPSGHTLRKDWMIQGGMTVVLAFIVLLQPADSVAVVGFVGAWAIVQGVYATIAGLSGRFATHDVVKEGR
jgi:uncharacterized membrane protein HdeD (DUF308 family)